MKNAWKAKAKAKIRIIMFIVDLGLKTVPTKSLQTVACDTYY